MFSGGLTQYKILQYRYTSEILEVLFTPIKRVSQQSESHKCFGFPLHIKVICYTILQSIKCSIAFVPQGIGRPKKGERMGEHLLSRELRTLIFINYFCQIWVWFMVPQNKSNTKNHSSGLPVKIQAQVNTTHLLAQPQQKLRLNYKTTITQNRQKIELYRSATTKELKKSHSFR